MKMDSFAKRFYGLLAVMLTLMLPAIAHASITAQAGPYRIEVVATPNPVALGKSRLLIKLMDNGGGPMGGATIRSLTQMQGMNMGEREAVATPQSGQPGVYVAPAQFAMEGEFNMALKIIGPQGTASVIIPIRTGQDTGTFAGEAQPGQATPNGVQPSPAMEWRPLMPWVIGGFVLAFVLFRVWRTGQRPDLRAVANRSVLGGLLLVGLILAGAMAAIHKYRRPGSMTPLEAQSMQMQLAAPAGSAPVELATAQRGHIENTVRYTGQAVGFVEQEVTPRMTGTITEMRVYAGDRVKRGQLLARLDTSQAAPQVANQRASLNMAAQGVGVARKEYQQALAAIHEAHAEVGMKTGAVESARADLTAAQEERASAQAQLEGAQSMSGDAAAQLEGAQADQKYWRDEIGREAALLKAGAVTQEEYQREKAQAENADAKVRQAQARVIQVQTQIQAAQSAVRKAEALVAAAAAKVNEARSELASHDAHVLSTQAAADSARQKIVQAEAGVAQARAILAGASATQGYSEIRAQVDGVVTQRVISPGVLVNPGQVLLRVAQISPIRLQANVTEGDLARVRVGSRVRVTGQEKTGTPLTARVTSLAPSIDPTARTGVVEAVVANTDVRFLPGQYVSLDISTGSAENALLIPTRAIRYHTAPSGGVISTQAMPFVWVAESVPGQAGQYTAREIQIAVGLSDGKNSEVRSGLKAGEKVITAGQDYLKDGDAVSTLDSLSSAAPIANRETSMSTMPMTNRGGSR